MKKSGKKSKSDRINALRKQYDAFLDEDKKRKDRNEFILGRLEKMRMLTPVMVPFRSSMGNHQISKYHYVNEDRPDYLRKIRFDDDQIPRSRPLDTCLDIKKHEQTILQEISKKYILIPKVRPTNENYVTYNNAPSESNDADWRNKYNILDELKRIEKEGSSEVTKDDPGNVNLDNDDKIENTIIENTNETPQIINKDPLCDIQDKNDGRVAHELQTNSDYNIDRKLPVEHTNNVMTVKTHTSENDVTKHNTESTNQEHQISDKVSEEFYLNEKSNFNQVENIQHDIKEMDNIIPKYADEICENDKNKLIIKNQEVELSNNEQVHSNNTSIFTEEEKNVHNFDNDAKSIETKENPVLPQNESITENIPQQNVNENVIIDNVNPSQIHEFETEQKEMFYSEETGYSQNADTMGFIQNEENTNEQYSYYNETQQEQPYYAEVNEHEESTERYDPNYAQQFAENYAENVNVPEYENQQYGVANYENEQEVTNVYMEQPDQQVLSNENYEQPNLEQVANLNYEQQPDNYEYEQSAQGQYVYENSEQHLNQPNEPSHYETQQYNSVGPVDPSIQEQNVYENQQEYIQHADQDITQNVGQELDQEEGYEEKIIVSNEPVAVENINTVESNVKVK